MKTRHIFTLEEVRVILIEHLNNIGDVKYIDSNKAAYEVTDDDDQFIEVAELFTLFIDE